MEDGRVIAIIIVLLIAVLCAVEAKVFERCELTRELLKNHFKKEFMSNWVCLIEQESERNTAAFVEKSSKRKNYGIFQIGSDWCKEGRKGGKCDITCEALLDEDIRDDSVCAQKVWTAEGFKYWPKWGSRCKGQRLPDVEKCPSFLYPPTRIRRNSRRRRWIIDQSLYKTDRSNVTGAPLSYQSLDTHPPYNKTQSKYT